MGEDFKKFLPKFGPADALAEREEEILRDRARAAERDAVAEREKHRARLASWGVPLKDLERVTCDELKPTQALTHAREHEKGDAPLLVLCGGAGCGKTTAAVWWIAQPGPVSPYLPLDSPVFLPAFRLQRLSRFNDAEMRRVELARRLVIDDLGLEYMDDKGAFVSFFDGVLDARYRNNLPLLITTNLQGRELAIRYKGRVADRLRESGRVYNIGDSSMRGEK